MRVPLLILHENVSEKWLETCHEKIEIQLHRIEHHVYDDLSDIVSHTFICDAYENINSRYAELIEIILIKHNVLAVWKEEFIPGTVEPIIGLTVYGSAINVKLAVNMISFCLNGFDRYYKRHVEELRLKRKRRRSRGITLPAEMDARKRTNQNILVKVNKLKTLIFKYIHEPVRKDELLIADYIMKHEKLDARHYKGMINLTYKAVKSRSKIIQLNRII